MIYTTLVSIIHTCQSQTQKRTQTHSRTHV